MAARSRDARYFCGPARCLVKRDGKNPVRSLTPLGPPSFGGVRDRHRPLRVKRVGFVMSAICPVYPKQQTFLGPVGTSHLGQERKSCLLANRLFSLMQK